MLGKVALPLIALSLAAYAPALSGWFLSDDAMIAGICPDGQNVAWAEVARRFTSDWRGFDGAEVRYFRPLVVVVQAFDAALWGLRPWGFHLTNVVLHALVGWLVFVLGKRLGATAPAALFAAAAFVLLPLHPESVAWISGRTDLVYALPALGSIAMFVEHRRTGARRALLASFALYVLALLAKENAVAVPLVVLALDVTLPRRLPERSPRASSLAALAGFGALSIAYMAWRTRALGDLYGGRRGDFFQAAEGNWTRFHTHLLENLEFFVLPYNRQIGDGLALHVGAAAAMGMLGLVALGGALGRRIPWRRVVAVLIAFLAAIAPISSSMHIQENLTSTRMWYLPMAFLCLALGMLSLSSFRAPNIAAAAGLLGAWLVLLRANLGPWVEAGELMWRVRDAHAATFGGGRTVKHVEGLPRIHRGAYLALYNVEGLAFPFIREPARPEQQARLRMVFDAERWTVRVEEDPSWRAAERLERDMAHGVLLFHPDGAPLADARLANVGLQALAEGPFSFRASNNDAWLVIPLDRDIAPPEAPGLRETAYLLIRPAPQTNPELFWIALPGQNFDGQRMIGLRPELTVIQGQVTHRQKDGFYVYAARLDTHPRWPGLHGVIGVRLDPTNDPGPFTIGYFNIAREAPGGLPVY